MSLKSEITATFNPQDLVGHVICDGIEIIETPTWNEESDKWNALTNVGGALCIIELTIRIKGQKHKTDIQ